MERVDLDKKLRDFLVTNGVSDASNSNSKHIFFNPPSSINMDYPCLLYERNDMQTWNANNDKYIINIRYVVTIISRDVDDELPRSFLKSFKNCSFDREYKSDNLNHTVFDLFY